MRKNNLKFSIYVPTIVDRRMKNDRVTHERLSSIKMHHIRIKFCRRSEMETQFQGKEETSGNFHSLKESLFVCFVNHEQ